MPSMQPPPLPSQRMRLPPGSGSGVPSNSVQIAPLKPRLVSTCGRIADEPPVCWAYVTGGVPTVFCHAARPRSNEPTISSGVHSSSGCESYRPPAGAIVPSVHRSRRRASAVGLRDASFSITAPVATSAMGTVD